MKPYIKVNDRELTLKQYFKALAILGSATCSELGDDDFIAVMLLPSMDLPMLITIKETLEDNDLFLESVQWYPWSRDKFRVWMLINDPHSSGETAK